MDTARKEHPLVDRTEPNLLEEVFPYSLPPHIQFEGPVVEYIDGEAVEFDFQSVKDRDIFITDTTFRDGQQARPPYTIDQMVQIYDLLSRLSGPNGVVRQTEFFLYTKNDRETLDRCRALGHEFPGACSGSQARLMCQISRSACKQGPAAIPKGVLWLGVCHDRQFSASTHCGMLANV